MITGDSQYQAQAKYWTLAPISSQKQIYTESMVSMMAMLSTTYLALLWELLLKHIVFHITSTRIG